MMPNVLDKRSLQTDRTYLRAQLKAAEEDPWGTTRLMWQNRLADVERQLAEFDEQASPNASVALVFRGGPVVGQRDIRLDFTSQVLDAYQRIVALALSDRMAENLKRTGRFPKADMSRLFVRDLVRGSMGFILEELPDSQVQLFDSPLKTAVEESTALIATLATGDESAFGETLLNTPGRLLVAVRKFAKVLNDAGADAEIMAHEQSVSLQERDVDTLFGRLSDVTVDEQAATVAGVLLGILPESHRFELQLEDGTTLSGPISDELAQRYRSGNQVKNLVLATVTAEITYVRTRRAEQLIKEVTFLDEVRGPTPPSLS